MRAIITFYYNIEKSTQYNIANKLEKVRIDLNIALKVAMTLSEIPMNFNIRHITFGEQKILCG